MTNIHLLLIIFSVISPFWHNVFKFSHFIFFKMPINISTWRPFPRTFSTICNSWYSLSAEKSLFYFPFILQTLLNLIVTGICLSYFSFLIITLISNNSFIFLLAKFSNRYQGFLTNLLIINLLLKRLIDACLIYGSQLSMFIVLRFIDT